MRIAGLAPWILAAALWPATGTAQRATELAVPGATRPLGQAQRLERRFLQVSAANVRLRADAARLVLARSNNLAVQELAGTLVARQEALQPELLRLLQARGMALPFPAAEHTRMLKQMAKLNGAKLDRAFLEDVVLRSLQADVANHEKLAVQAEDPVLKAWAARQLPTLRLHLAQAGKGLPNPSLRGQRAV